MERRRTSKLTMRGRLVVTNAVSATALQTSLKPTGRVTVHPCRTMGSPFRRIVGAEVELLELCLELFFEASSLVASSLNSTALSFSSSLVSSESLLLSLLILGTLLTFRL